MKQLLITFVLAATTSLVHAQVLDPVKWTFTAKKIDAKTYEIYLNANIQMGWHLYSQTQPKDAIINPTEIVFSRNPLVSLDGKAKENGKMEVYSDKRLGISANQYSNQVQFVQKIKLKAAAKTNVSGSVEYQTCDDKKCLPAKKMMFSLALK
jgi:hypothetical protein